MPKARRRKNTEFEPSMTRSVFYHGKPNTGKREVLGQIQSFYAALINQYVKMIDAEHFYMQLIKNDKKDPDIRAFEKQNRPKGVNSAYCQNAFDDAFTALSNRLNDIRLDMMPFFNDLFVQSKVLFAWCLEGREQGDMFFAMLYLFAETNNECYSSYAKEIAAMSPEDFNLRMKIFADLFSMSSLERAVPAFKETDVRLDTRIMKIETSDHISAPYVISISNPFKRGEFISVPLSLSRDAARRLEQYTPASSVSFRLKGDDLKVTRAFKKSINKPAVLDEVGVDTGIIDCFYTSKGEKFGSMKEVLDFYQKTVEPAFAYLSDLRNKKRAIKHYLRTHSLPPEVRKKLISKIDRLEHMIREAKAPFRKLRRYYQMLDKEIRDSVDGYMASITRQDLTVLEKLDIREFNKSRKANGMMSTFARGKLQQRLMQELNWHGFDFLEVDPAYTSQTCPVCSNIDKANRNGKTFKCTCCGYTDDADHVGALSIKARVNDKEILAACEKYQYDKDERHKAIKEICSKRNTAYIKIHPVIKPA